MTDGIYDQRAKNPYKYSVFLVIENKDQIRCAFAESYLANLVCEAFPHLDLITQELEVIA